MAGRRAKAVTDASGTGDQPSTMTDTPAPKAQVSGDIPSEAAMAAAVGDIFESEPAPVEPETVEIEQVDDASLADGPHTADLAGLDADVQAIQREGEAAAGA